MAALVNMAAIGRNFENETNKRGRNEPTKKERKERRRK